MICGQSSNIIELLSYCWHICLSGRVSCSKWRRKWALKGWGYFASRLLKIFHSVPCFASLEILGSSFEYLSNGVWIHGSFSHMVLCFRKTAHCQNKPRTWPHLTWNLAFLTRVRKRLHLWWILCATVIEACGSCPMQRESNMALVYHFLFPKWGPTPETTQSKLVPLSKTRYKARLLHHCRFELHGGCCDRVHFVQHPR